MCSNREMCGDDPDPPKLTDFAAWFVVESNVDQAGFVFLGERGDNLEVAVNEAAMVEIVYSDITEARAASAIADPGVFDCAEGA